MKTKKEAGAIMPTAARLEDLTGKEAALLQEINKLYNDTETKLNKKGIIDTNYHITQHNAEIINHTMLQNANTIIDTFWGKLATSKKKALFALYLKYPDIKDDFGLKDKYPGVLFSVYPFGLKEYLREHLTLRPIHTNKVTSAIDSIYSKGFKKGENGLQAFNYSVENDDITIEYNDKDNKPIDTNAQDILDAINMKWTRNIPNTTKPGELASIESRLMELTTAEYMDIVKITDKKYARKRFKDGMKKLAGTTIKYKRITYRGKKKIEQAITSQILKPYTETIEKKKTTADGEEITTTTEEILINDSIAFILDYDFAIDLTRAKIMHHNLKIGQIDSNKHPYSRRMAKKLEEIFYTLNLQSISVIKLLEAIGSLPEYDQLKKKGRITMQIINPIERDLDHLVELGILKEWTYYDSNNKPLPKGIIEKNMKYSTWINLYIHFELGMDTSYL